MLSYRTPEEEMALKNAASRAAYGQAQAGFQAQRQKLAAVDTAALERRMDAGDIEGAQRYAAGRLAYDTPGLAGDTAQKLLERYPGAPNATFLGLSKGLRDAQAAGVDLSRPNGPGQQAVAEQLVNQVAGPFEGARAARMPRASTGGDQPGGGQTWAGAAGQSWMPGSVNGQSVAVPTAGHYVNGDYARDMAAISPDLAAAAGAPGGVFMSQLGRAQTARAKLEAGLPITQEERQANPSLGVFSDIRQKLDLQRQQQAAKEQERALELAGVKAAHSGAYAPKTPLEVRKGYLEGYRQTVDDWNNDQTEAKRLKSGISEAIRKAGGDLDSAEVVVGWHGGKPEKISIYEARSRVQQLERPKPSREDYAALQGVDTSYLDPNLGAGAPAAASVPRSGYRDGFAGAPGQTTPEARSLAGHAQIDPAAAREIDAIPANNLAAAIAHAEANPKDYPPQEVAYLRTRQSELQRRGILH